MLSIMDMILEVQSAPKKRFFIMLNSTVGKIQCDVVPSGYLLTLKGDDGGILSSTIRGVDTWDELESLLASRLGVKLKTSMSHVLEALNQGFSGVETDTSTLRSAVSCSSKELWEKES